MIKKTLLLSALCTLPFVNTTVVPISNNTVANETVVEDEPVVQEEKEACTIMYVGKKVSTTGKAYIARSADAPPTTMNFYSKVFAHNELANKTIEGKDGFKWKMPSTTYKYVATPRNPNMGKGLHWEVSGINEMGVAVTATLSCSTYTKALEADPLVKTGITEDNITQIIAAVATSAREGIQYIANVIDKEGSGEMNAILVTDKEETWYMEMYTGHQYCAVKLPDDKACTLGNEFMLNSLKDFDDNDIIKSQNLFTLPKTAQIVKYDSTGQTADKNIHLYNTYAGEVIDKVPVQGGFVDGCHMRTWIGRYRFAKKELEEHQNWKIYEICRDPITGKFDPFFTPDNKLSPNDIISYMRDRFETILNNTSDLNYTYFNNNLKSLRPVGVETAYQIHVISVDPNLPKELAIQELLCLSNSNYSPFIPVNNAITSFVDAYSTVTPEYCYDYSSAPSIYKRLNGLAATNRTLYGLPVQSFIEEHEVAWQKQYDDILSQAKSLSLKKAQQAITAFCQSLQAEGLLLSNVLFNDLLFHIENTIKGEQPTPQLFKPLVHLQYYSTLYGWTYTKANNVATMTKGSNKLTVDLTYEGKDPKCKVKYNDLAEEEAEIHSNYGEPFVQYDVIHKYIGQGIDEVASLNINDYIPKNNALWAIVPAVGIVLIIAGITIPFVIIKKREKKLAMTPSSTPSQQS